MPSQSGPGITGASSHRYVHWAYHACLGFSGVPFLAQKKSSTEKTRTQRTRKAPPAKAVNAGTIRPTSRSDGAGPDDTRARSDENEAPDQAAHAFPIVGIGASAGGLSAFETFFSAMPADLEPGMAFVLVQHLSPDHKSILVDLVKRYTRMNVFEAEHGMVVQPNCTYIIPPNRDLSLAGAHSG